MNCRKCHSEAFESSHFCRNCGAKMKESDFMRKVRILAALFLLFLLFLMFVAIAAHR